MSSGIAYSTYGLMRPDELYVVYGLEVQSLWQECSPLEKMQISSQAFVTLVYSYLMTTEEGMRHVWLSNHQGTICITDGLGPDSLFAMFWAAPPSTHDAFRFVISLKPLILPCVLVLEKRVKDSSDMSSSAPTEGVVAVSNKDHMIA